MAQHGGGGHGGGGHGGGGHSGGGGAYHGGGGGGAYRGGYSGGSRYGGYGREYHHDFDRGGEYHRYGGGYYPYGSGFWWGFYPQFYYGPDAYYYGPGWYDYSPSYTDSPIYVPQTSRHVEDEFSEWTQLDQRVAARIFVPVPDAQLWVDDQEMTTGGVRRSFVSPPLDAGTYTYTFRARWTENGKTIERTKSVEVQPGDRISVNLDSAAGR
jgi:uncharacterized protein (TIGR03000 family)